MTPIEGLYAITDPTVGDPVEQARAALAGGAKIVQYRHKSAKFNVLCRNALMIKELCARHHALFVVNDRPGIAWAVEAPAIHLGQEDMPIELARRLLPNALVGLSCDNLDEALAASERGADYVAIGPIFGTATKPDAGPVVGLEGLRQIVSRSDKPIVAIGGIHLGNIAEVARTGAAAAAVVSAVCQATDPVQATIDLVRAWNDARS